MNINTSKIMTFDGYWTIEYVRDHPSALFVYGDNDVGVGKGGQAIIRDLPNTAGIPTKKYPANYTDSYYTDNQYYENTTKIVNAINKIIQLSKLYKHVVLPCPYNHAMHDFRAG